MKGRKWFITGSFCLGLLIGFMVGLSVSPVVNTVLGLVFAFTGGSIVILIKGREDNELELIGKTLTVLSVAMIIGAVSGILMRANDMLRFEKTVEMQAPFQLERTLEVDDIIMLNQKKVASEVIQAMLKADLKKKTQAILTLADITKLKENDVPPNIIQAMITVPQKSNQTPKGNKGSTVLTSGETQPDEFEKDLK